MDSDSSLSYVSRSVHVERVLLRLFALEERQILERQDMQCNQHYFDSFRMSTLYFMLKKQERFLRRHGNAGKREMKKEMITCCECYNTLNRKGRRTRRKRCR